MAAPRLPALCKLWIIRPLWRKGDFEVAVSREVEPGIHRTRLRSTVDYRGHVGDVGKRWILAAFRGGFPNLPRFAAKI